MSAHCPECGAVQETKNRSLPDHRRFFGLLRACFMNWQESHPFQPANDEHLRAWALVEAGYCDVEFIPYPEACNEPAVKALFRLAIEATHAAHSRARAYTFLRVSAGGVEVRWPRSISFKTISQREFSPIREAVEDILSAALGVPADQLLREKAA
jgi:hypothetical protein